MVEGCILRTTERDSSCTKQVPAAHGEKEVNKQWLNLFDDLEVSKGHQKKSACVVENRVVEVGRWAD